MSVCLYFLSLHSKIFFVQQEKIRHERLLGIGNPTPWPEDYHGLNEEKEVELVE